MKPNPITIAIGTLLLVIFVLLLFIFQVRKTEMAVVTTFGRITGQAGPGAHFRWPWPIQSVEKVDRRIHNYESKVEQLYTSDGNNLLVTVFVGWQISDPAIFHTRFNADLRKAEAALEGLIRNAYSGVVGKHPFADFISTDEKKLKFVEIEQEMQARIQADCLSQTNGLSPVFLGIKRLGLPEAVTSLVFQRMQSERNLKVNEILGDAERQATEIRSGADAESASLLAEADAQATKIQGEGERIAAKYWDVYKQEPELAIYLMKLASLEQLLQKNTTLILDENSSPVDLFRQQKPLRPQN